MSTKNQPSPYRYINLGPLSMKMRQRSVIATLLIAIAYVIMAIVALGFGDYALSPVQVVSALFGTGDDAMAQFFVQRMRAPRVVLALLVGAALGIAGAIFQSLTRNPLGSPDVTGFNVGAATGALIQIIIFNGGPVAIALGALFGGFATGAVVYLLSRGPGMSGTTFVLVGMGTSFILQGVNSLLVVKASLSAAQTAAQWMSGSFNATTWSQVALVAVALGILIPASLLLSRPLNMMMTGSDLASSLGVRTGRRNLELIFVGVVLVAVTVAAAGPIAFVALAAPQLAKRLTGNAGAGIMSAALMGAALVLCSDIIAQRLFAPTQLPVGVVTGSLGGIYLIWLLAREWRKDPS